MKCDELKYYCAYRGEVIDKNCDEYKDNPKYDTFYMKADVDAAIAELKAKLESVQASMYADVVDANMENRRLKRALWLARAYFCGRSSEYFSGMASRCKIGQEDFYKEVSERAQRYLKASYKCQAKAEEYK